MVLTLLLVPYKSEAQKNIFEAVIQKELSFQSNSTSNALVVQNIFGPITIEGYSGQAIQLEVKKKITADTEKGLELGKTELDIAILERGGRLIIHPSAPYFEYNENGLRFNWCDNSKEPSYRHWLSFKLKVPKNIRLNIGTVNDGDIRIANTQGNYIKVNNVNGGIALNNVAGQTNVHCINGEVDITYTDNPTKASTYYSLNGDINIIYQNALSADISFKSMNGELFTDFDVTKQYTRTSRNEGKKDNGRYKYEATPIVQIGKGGIDLDFETLNGNVYLKKI